MVYSNTLWYAIIIIAVVGGLFIGLIIGNSLGISSTEKKYAVQFAEEAEITRMSINGYIETKVTDDTFEIIFINEE
jgi:hypothetical protein